MPAPSGYLAPSQPLLSARESASEGTAGITSEASWLEHAPLEAADPSRGTSQMVEGSQDLQEGAGASM